MRPKRPFPLPDARGPAAAAVRAGWQGALLLPLGLSSALLVVLCGFTVAMTLIWPG